MMTTMVVVVVIVVLLLSLLLLLHNSELLKLKGRRVLYKRKDGAETNSKREHFQGIQHQVGSLISLFLVSQCDKKKKKTNKQTKQTNKQLRMQSEVRASENAESPLYQQICSSSSMVFALSSPTPFSVVLIRAIHFFCPYHHACTAVALNVCLNSSESHRLVFLVTTRREKEERGERA